MSLCHSSSHTVAVPVITWPMLSITSSKNSAAAHVVYKSQPSLNAGLVLAPGLQSPEGNKHPGVYSRLYTHVQYDDTNVAVSI